MASRAESDTDSSDDSTGSADLGRSELWALLRRMWPLFLGNMLEWYEFAVYGYLAGFLKANYFGGSATAVWLGYGASFIMRPIGGILFGVAADRCGRRPVTLISLLGMVFATGMQGALPVAQGEGGSAWSLYALVLLRLLQGVCVGGEEGAVISMLAEEAPLRYKNLATACYFTVAFVAFMITAGLVFLLEAILSPAQMMSWGWRLPFLLVLPFGLVAFWGRRKIVETEDFRQAIRDASIEPKPSRRVRFLAKFSVVRQYCGHVALGAAAAAGFSALFYTASAWSIAHLKAKGLPNPNLLAVSQQAVLVVTSPFFGWLGDQVGVATMMLAGAFLTMILGVPVFAIMDSDPTNWGTAFLCLGIGYGLPISICASASSLFCAELFPTQGRSLGIGLTHNLAMSLVGGAAGYTAQKSLQFSELGPGIYISAWGALSTLAISIGLAARAAGRAELAHMRSDPYFNLVPGRTATDAGIVAGDIGAGIEETSEA
ncbi:unnamed protein product [Polarella glacialis]|uniref:Major facilitator superfamily (MFS) profile domain-containing protein n=1 Tax=Polarella glacialis TaxID=89957 RepID=A0A813GIA4_POLGL|nr:unnamed protein product [Polarella glacialis]